MPQQRVVIASDEPGRARSEWWASELPGFWPRPADPISCHCVSFDDLAAELSHTDGLTRTSRRSVVVLLIHTGGARAPLLQLVDRLVGGRTPALVLAEHPDSARIELEPHGLLVEALTTDRPTVARILHALSARQAAVDVLSGELRVARASQGGLSGEISRLHDELQLAGTVQKRFLPKQMPELNGYEFGVLYRPCGYVSGDIYDLVRLDEQRVAFMLADAVGHGVPAALLTLVLGRALRQAEPIGGDRTTLHCPSATLARLNEELCIENEAGDRFATAVCGVIDSRENSVTLASAGHPAPLVIESGSSARSVAGGEGPLLGVFPHADYPAVTVPLRPGETLLLFSDGFETAFPPDGPDPGRSGANEAYVAQFSQAIGRGDDGGVQRALERVVTALDAQSGSLHQRDDLTALALRRLPDALGRIEPSRCATRAAA